MSKTLLGPVEQLGREVLFLRKITYTLLKKPCRFSQVVDQTWSVSMQSLPTTAMAGFFVGAIMAVQFTLQMRDFGALGYLGGLATSGTVREVGPLLIAFMLSGKVGAYTSAELGTMKVTEQIDAIRCLGADPLQEVILPRFLGIIISASILLGVGLVMSVGGGMFIGNIFAGVTPEEYLRHIPTILNLPSVLLGFIKCFLFAVVLATVCTSAGYHTTGGAKGVGRAVISTAVSTMIGIVVIDWIISQIANSALEIWKGLL